ncbi:hypothetical protein E2C01_044641 [Portunus trituberculatus]|uniref:Uncharacterized protein n=1 Tax=Portunus trituberculatus TaxID=210409 RepID=A0A5B7FZQ6_PORTR|nr:hypothetical protein [Portunus trituberculatus]
MTREGANWVRRRIARACELVMFLIDSLLTLRIKSPACKRPSLCTAPFLTSEEMTTPFTPWSTTSMLMPVGGGNGRRVSMGGLYVLG